MQPNDFSQRSLYDQKSIAICLSGQEPARITREPTFRDTQLHQLHGSSFCMPGSLMCILTLSDPYLHRMNFIYPHPEATPLGNIIAEFVVKPFISSWVSLFGVPDTMTTNKERLFQSHLFSQLLPLFRISRIYTTTYPAANGVVERFHRHLKTSLKACTQTGNWLEGLLLIMLGVRRVYKANVTCTPAELAYGTTLHLPG